MAASKPSIDTQVLKGHLFVAAPIVILLFLGRFVANSYIGELGDEQAVIAATEAANWLFFAGLAGAVGTLFVVARMKFDSGSTPMGSQNIDKFIERVASGDFSAAIEEAQASGMLSPTAEEALSGMESQNTLVSGFYENQSRLIDSLNSSLNNISETLTHQASAVEEVSGFTDQHQSDFRSLTGSIDGLAASSEESASSIVEMVTINNEVRENIHNLALSIQEATSSIEEMTFSSKEVANNIEDLSTAAEDTAASMSRMDLSINQVETNANETSKLSETVTSDAEIGVTAIKQTIQGIDRIKESSRIAADVIGNLGEKISEIGNILNVIDDVAEQTNLLALNAAIIAAQAGEHGRGFAVVADEIKALAERTGASTKEIADLIKTIQNESRNAINVMARGVEDVEDGVRLGHNAEDALRNIVDSAKRSTLMIQNIAGATVEQARGSKEVTNAISRIAETVQQIALATQEQAKGAEHIMQSAERIKVITQQVERSAEEQKRGGRQVTQAIENIREIVSRVSQNQRTQGETLERGTSAVRTIRDSSGRLLTLSQDMGTSLADSSGSLSQLDVDFTD